MKIPSERMPAIISAHFLLSHGVKPHASAGVKVSGESGAGMRRVRLRRREHVAGHAALRRGPLLDRIERRAGLAIEQEEATHLGDLRDARATVADAVDLEERRLRGHVVVPVIVVHGLEVPAHRAAVGVERDDRARVVVEAVALAAVVVGRGVAGGHEDEAALGVARQDRPHVRRAGRVLLAGLALRRSRATPAAPDRRPSAARRCARRRRAPRRPARRCAGCRRPARRPRRRRGSPAAAT